MTLFAIALIILRTWFVVGLAIPLRVASGSMAETLLGPHFEYTCGHCGYQQHWDGAGSEPRPPHACWRCQREIDNQQAVARAGDRVIVNRASLVWSFPQRWDVVVFRCPDRANRLCVKRVLGLPGELIELRAGDVYVDGILQAKPPAVQRSMRQLVHREGNAARRWQAAADSTWTWTGTHWQAERPESRDAAWSWLVYRHPGGEPIYDDVPYNASHSRRLAVAGDLALSLRVDSEAGGCLALRCGNERQMYEAKWCQSGEVVVAGFPTDRPQLREEIARARIAAASKPRRLELALIDQQLTLLLDEQALIVARLTTSSPAPLPTVDRLQIGAAGGRVVIDDLTLWRDISYAARPAGQWRLAAGELFVVGDNAPISADSRDRRQPALPARLLIGKVVAAR